MYVLSRPFIRVIYLAPRRSGISSNTSAFVSNQRIWEGSNFTLSYPLAAVYSSKVASSHQAWIAVRDLMKAYILRTSPRIFSGNSVSPACQLRNISSPTIYSLSLASFYSSRVVYKQLCLLNCYSGSMKSFMEKKLVGELPLRRFNIPHHPRYFSVIRCCLLKPCALQTIIPSKYLLVIIEIIYWERV